jgi:hypothetical protein
LLIRETENLTAAELATPSLRPSVTEKQSRAMSRESAQAALGKFAEAVNTGKFDLFDEVVA